MKVLVTADVHITDRVVCGRSRLEVGERLLMDIAALAVHHKVRHVFFNGDLWDKKHGTPRAVLRVIYRCLKHMKYQLGLQVHWIRGNHETPDNSDPHDTMMSLFGEVCHTVIRPAILDLPAAKFFLLPWYPAQTFIKHAQTLAIKARGKRGKPNILLAHVGLREGRVSPSNIQLPQRVSVTNLYPEFYDVVLLGDYHSHQMLKDNVLYTGAPIPHLFGDEGYSEGPWLLETENMDMGTLELPNGYPKFRKWALTEPGTVTIPGYSPADYNRIYAPVTSHQSLRVMYPGAELRILSVETKLDMSQSRISAEEARDPAVLVERFLSLRGKVGEEATLLKETALELIREV